MGITILPTKKREKHSLCLRSNRQTNVWREGEGAKRHSRFPLENYGPTTTIPFPQTDRRRLMCYPPPPPPFSFSPGQTMPLFLFTPFFLSFGRNNSTFFRWKASGRRKLEPRVRNSTTTYFSYWNQRVSLFHFLKKSQEMGTFYF